MLAAALPGLPRITAARHFRIMGAGLRRSERGGFEPFQTFDHRGSSPRANGSTTGSNSSGGDAGNIVEPSYYPDGVDRDADWPVGEACPAFVDDVAKHAVEELAGVGPIMDAGGDWAGALARRVLPRIRACLCYRRPPTADDDDQLAGSTSAQPEWRPRITDLYGRSDSSVTSVVYSMERRAAWRRQHGAPAQGDSDFVSESVPLSEAELPEGTTAASLRVARAQREAAAAAAALRRRVAHECESCIAAWLGSAAWWRRAQLAAAWSLGRHTGSMNGSLPVGHFERRHHDVSASKS